jgi:hypothetical protein
MALKTVQSKNLQQITIHSRVTFANQIGETDHQAWQDLDRQLVQFWTSHSIHPKFTYEGMRVDGLRAFAPSLLPELTGRGLVDLIEDRRWYTVSPQ